MKMTVYVWARTFTNVQKTQTGHDRKTNRFSSAEPKCGLLTSRLVVQLFVLGAEGESLAHPAVLFCLFFTRPPKHVLLGVQLSSES